MLWWQPILVTFPEPSIWNDWGEFVNQLNTYFGQPNLAQASEHALKMHHYQHVNKYMIKFSKHAMYTVWDDAALYGEFYRGLDEHIKDQLLSLDRPQMFQQLLHLTFLPTSIPASKHNKHVLSNPLVHSFWPFPPRCSYGGILLHPVTLT